MCDDREAIIARQDQEKKDQQDILYAMELRYMEREAEAQQEFQSLVDELKNKVSACKKLVGFTLKMMFMCKES